jgi:DHA1 family inner membrane transport protein
MFAALYYVLPREELHQPRQNGTISSFRVVLASATALAGISIGLLVDAGNELVNLTFGVWLEDSFGLKILALSAAAAVIGLAELGGEGLVAGFSDRMGKPRAIALGLAANCLAALLLPLLGRSTPGALLGLFLYYITFEFTLVSTIPMMTEVLPAARATLMAFNIAGFSLGRALGALLAVPLYGYGFWVVAVGAAVFNLAALGALRFMTARKNITPDAQSHEVL